MLYEITEIRTFSKEKKSQNKFGLIAASFTVRCMIFCCSSTTSIFQLNNKLKVSIFGESNSINSNKFGVCKGGIYIEHCNLHKA